ncbi:hypothetical protein SNE40_022641 [Patella caerulea]|uniref:Coiled-coil domain-containing protein 148 n=1 Tax=Patella caerulea TaxID=87958 RepID=A0AAN8G0U2_PATCE
MSGRDLRSFVTNYRSAEIDKLARRATDGLGSNKYKDVDYYKLNNLSSAKRFTSHKFSMKLEKIEKLCKRNKENNLIKQHKLLWQKEFLKLNHARKKIQAEIDEHMRDNRTGICAQVYKEFEYYNHRLEHDFESFKKQTAEPLWNLREDLEYWLTENKSNLSEGHPEALEKHEEVKSTIESVEKQQAAIFQHLQGEQITLEKELNSDEMLDLCPVQLERRPHIKQGIPDEAIQCYCPDENLKTSILNEFLHLDAKYSHRIEELDRKHTLAKRYDMCGDWYEDEHFIFLAVYDQYPSELNNRRNLLLDRLKRHLPNKTRHELISHEDWWLDYKYYNERLRGVMLDWARDRKELLNKAFLIFEEAQIVHNLEEKKYDHRNHQKEICDALFNKVLKWREQKEEAMKLEAKLEEQQRQELAERMEREKERENNKRMEAKSKINSYQEEKERRRNEESERDKRRLEELNRLLEEQAEYDRERVKFRKEQVDEKNEERKRQILQQEEEERKKEERLEALRETVRITAESDPERLLQNTEAWESRLTEDENAPLDIQKPLFDVHTFTSNQVTSDPRIRIEQKLREAGLHNSAYARSILSEVKPLHPPRRDMISTVFKD